MAARFTQIVLEVARSAAGAPGIPVNATTSFVFAGSGSAAVPVKHVYAVTMLGISQQVISGGDFQVSASVPLILGGNPHAHCSSIYVSATTGLGFTVGSRVPAQWVCQGATQLGFADVAAALIKIGPRVWYVSATTSLGMRDTQDGKAYHTYSAGYAPDRTWYKRNGSWDQPIPHQNFGDAHVGYYQPYASVLFADVASVVSWQNWIAATASSFRFADKADAVKTKNAMAATALGFRFAASAPRDVFASATTTIGLTQSSGHKGFFDGIASVSFSIAGFAVALHSGILAASRLAFVDRASAVALLPPGGGVPGRPSSLALIPAGAPALTAGGGMRTVLLPDVSSEFPYSFAETPSGLILIANGIDPMQRWDGLTGLADTAGVLPPSGQPGLGGTGVGTITGTRAAFVRFIDQYGNCSNLSQISNVCDFGTDGLIESIAYNKATGIVTVYSPSHRLATGSPIVIDGVLGLALANGQWVITVTDADHFTLDGLTITTGIYQQGGRWVFGIKVVSYTGVPVPAEAKIVRRQILRNLDGNSEVFYVDIDTGDLASTEFASTADDDTLSAGVPVPISTIDETPQANRYGVPPTHKAILAAHLGRIFAAGDVSYTRGNCQPVFGQPAIGGVGTAWRKSMVGRMIFMAGATSSYEIAGVDEDNQIISTTSPVLDALGPFTSYSIRPAIGERRFVYFTEPALPEAWPPWNAISLPEYSDEITGLMVKGSFLYILEKRHISKFTFQSDPSRDGFVFLSTMRGCVNNRCWVMVEDTAYMLDEVGLHAFDGQNSVPISEPIQTLFQQVGLSGLQVNWQADQRYWHAAHDPVRDTIRWFVTMTGSVFPRHAIAYDYRRKRFWLEEYPFAVSSSTVGTIGFRRSIAGSDARRVLCLGEGSLDAVDAGNGLRGHVSSAGPLSLTDSSAQFPPGLAGAPVSIASGKGVQQQRRIAANTGTTLSIDRPWLVRPDSTSVYQVGGVNWTWQSGWFKFVEEEQSNSRDIELTFQPLRSDGSLNMRLYYDHSVDPRRWARTLDEDGLGTVDGQPEVTVDMARRDGQALYRSTGHRDPQARGDSWVSVELAGVQSGEVMRVYQVTIDGVRHQ